MDIHDSVLLNESIALLEIKPGGVYIDGTFGRGGHTKAIIDSLEQMGILIVFDKDPDAIKYAVDNLNGVLVEDYIQLASKPRLSLVVVNDSFARFDYYLEILGVSGVDGILLDLGVSSPQLDDESRGFSFRFDSKLDMRMDNSKGVAASVWLNNATYEEIAKVLWEYGEERFSRKIASNILKRREVKEIETTFDLVEIIKRSIPQKFMDKHPAMRSFQAIRIYINNELTDLDEFLGKFPQKLNKSGRLVVISFHSLEDRQVKQCFSKLTEHNKLPKWVMKEDEAIQYKVIAKKIKPSLKEINANKRAKSALMRALVKLY